MNSQVIRPEEKRLLARLVDIMVALDLRFVQEKSEDGNLVYRLDPYVYLKTRCSSFADLSQADRRVRNV